MNRFKKTKRSFYGKWLYKVSINLEGGSVIRCRTLDQLDDYFKSQSTRNLSVSSLAYRAVSNQDRIVSVAKFLDALPKDQHFVRCEQSIFDIYTNEAHIFKLIVETYKDSLRAAFEPDVENLSLLQSKKNIVVKKYPHNRYKFKVFLQPHKVKDVDQKLEFLNWCESQQGKVTVTEAIKSWFITQRWNWDRRYILVEDEQTLLMLKLKNSDAVGTIYDYVISDK
jgi:hypothetical protein